MKQHNDNSLTFLSIKMFIQRNPNIFDVLIHISKYQQADAWVAMSKELDMLLWR